MTNLWSGRFDTAPDAGAFEFGASFRFDRRLFEDDVTGSLAWGRVAGFSPSCPAMILANFAPIPYRCDKRTFPAHWLSWMVHRRN